MQSCSVQKKQKNKKKQSSSDFSVLPLNGPVRSCPVLSVISVGVLQSLKMLLPLSITGPARLLLCDGADRQTAVCVCLCVCICVFVCEASVHVLGAAAGPGGGQHRREARGKGEGRGGEGREGGSGRREE